MLRQGFKAVIVLTGHYGAAQQMVVRDLAVRLCRSLGVPVLGTPEYFLALDVGYRGDHAAWGETSLMLYLDPQSVDLTQLGNPPHQGVGGRDPREATRADGEKLAETIISRLARLAQRMPTWESSHAREVHRSRGRAVQPAARPGRLREARLGRLAPRSPRRLRRLRPRSWPRRSSRRLRA